MDHYTVRIANLTPFDLTNRFEDGKTPERLKIDYYSAKHDDNDSFCLADVLIVGSDLSPDSINLVKTSKASYAELVLMVELDQFLALESDFVSQFFDVWILEDKMMSYRIGHFLKRMLAVMDAELCTKQLDTLIDSVPDLIWYKDVIGAHHKVNQSFCKTVNKTKDQIKYRGHCYIWDLEPEEYEQGEFVCMETEEVVIEEQKTFLFDEKVKIGEEMRQLKTYKSAIVGRNGETVGTVGIARDVTDVWNTHEEFCTLINSLPSPMMMVDKKYHLISVNAQFDDRFDGFDKENFDINTFGIEIFGEEICYETEESITVERSWIKGDKQEYFMVQKSPVYDVFHELSAYFYIFRDITAEKAYEKKLRSMSEIDELTQISNRKGIRKYFDAYHQKMVNEANPFAVVMIDLDYFKKYNDHYGHLKGDDVIRVMGKILDELQQDNDHFVARYGGEEFILLVKNKSYDEVEELVVGLQQRLKSEAIVHERSSAAKCVSMSVGVAYFPLIAPSLTTANLIQHADNSLYIAKNQGRNRYIMQQF